MIVSEIFLHNGVILRSLKGTAIIRLTVSIQGVECCSWLYHVTLVFATVSLSQIQSLSMDLICCLSILLQDIHLFLKTN